MKRRLLLSALSCVLALGLVTACNDEEEDLSGGDSGTQTDGGGSGSDTGSGGDGTGSGGGTKEAVTLTNYTLAFTFIDEDEEPTTLGEDVDLYISGDWNSWSFDICTLGEDGVYTLTIASIDAGTYEYKGVTVATGETPASDWSNVEEVITGTSGTNGNAELVVLASEGDNYTHAIPVSITGGVIAEPFDPEKYTFSYLITIIVDETEGTALEAAPEGVELYVAGDFNTSSGDTWADPIKLYDNGDGTYYLGLDFVPTADKSFEILADDTTDSTQDMWGYIIGEHTITSEEVSSVEEHPVVSISVTTEYVGWYIDGGVFPPLGEDVEFYVVIYDNSGNDSAITDSMTTGSFGSQVSCWSDGTSDSCTATQTKTSDGCYAYYSEVAKAPINTNSWFNFVLNEATMNISATNVPTNTEGTPVYVNYGWMSSSWFTEGPWNANDSSEGTWYYLSAGQTIAQFVGAFSTSN